MTKASDNAFPSLLITEGTEPSAPAAGKQRLYIDSTSHLLKATNSSGTERNIEGGSTYSYLVHRLTATTTNAAVTIDVNSTSYLVFSATAFIHDWDKFPATHFMISCLGQSSAAANTITMQLTPFADGTNPVSAGGNDIVVTNTFGFFTSGWVAVSDAMAGIDELTLAMKGSSATVDLAQRYIEIHFKIT